MPRSITRRRSGLALLFSLVALTVLGALVAGAFAAALRDARGGSEALQRQRALGAAEYGLYATLAPSRWRTGWSASDSVGLMATRVDLLDDEASDTVRVWKPSPSSILLVATGVARGRVPARRRLALLLALAVPAVPEWAALTARERVEVGEESTIRGADTMPAADCPAATASDDAAAVAVADDSLVDTAACTSGACLVGTPPVAELAAAAYDESYERFGQVTRASLVAAARPLPAASTLEPRPALDASGACDTGDPANLGDPDATRASPSPCGAYRPAVYVPGDLRLAGGVGQGTLIVDGDLVLEGGAHFYGLVLVRGTLRLADGAELHGAALARRASLMGRSHLQRSACSLWRAERALALPRPAAGPAWAEMPW